MAVDRGRLVITPISGRPVPLKWLEQHGGGILAQVASRAGLLALAYVGYSVGNYGKHLAGGVALQFVELNTQKPYFSVFNVETRRRRTTKSGKAGSPLPQGQFWVGKRSAFAQFWQSTGLPYQRLSSLHRRMGRLAELVFVAEISHGEKLLSASLKPLEVSRLVNKQQTTGEQSVHNLQTSIVNKKARRSQQAHGIQRYSTTGGNNCGNTVNGNTGNDRVIIPAIYTDNDSSHDEWFADYDKEPGFSINSHDR